MPLLRLAMPIRNGFRSHFGFSDKAKGPNHTIRLKLTIHTRHLLEDLCRHLARAVRE